MRDQEAKQLLNTLPFPEKVEENEKVSCTLEGISCCALTYRSDCLALWNREKNISVECTECQVQCSSSTIIQYPKVRHSPLFCNVSADVLPLQPIKVDRQGNTTRHSLWC